ncbi:hypothetical protein [Nonomuraea sp. NPDC005692]|uniref:hypothetical protein n=1 Tax=Nonomuraea sp. NPDC005692 TaxID=3157168 RepID=UPI0033E6A580
MILEKEIPEVDARLTGRNRTGRPAAKDGGALMAVTRTVTSWRTAGLSYLTAMAQCLEGG